MPVYVHHIIFIRAGSTTLHSWGLCSKHTVHTPYSLDASLAGQPLHKREEEGSGVMPIHELFQRLAVTQCMQNCTCEDLAPGRSEQMVGTVLTNYWTRRSGTWLVSLRVWDNPIVLVMMWSNLIGLHSWLQQVQLAYRHDTRPFLFPLVKGLAHQTTLMLYFGPKLVPHPSNLSQVNLKREGWAACRRCKHSLYGLNILQMLTSITLFIRMEAGPPIYHTRPSFRIVVKGGL